jgi:hypothetical protein
MIQNFHTKNHSPKIKIFSTIRPFLKSLVTAAELRRNRIIPQPQVSVKTW